MKNLGWCSNCKEFSMKLKSYSDKNNRKKTTCYCLNKGCGNKFSFNYEQMVLKDKKEKRSKR